MPKGKKGFQKGHKFFKGGERGWFKKGVVNWKAVEMAMKVIYKGEKVGYRGLHIWVTTKLGKPNKCARCKTTKAKRFEWANKNHLYKRKLSDWIRLCPKCHYRYDRKFKLKGLRPSRDLKGFMQLKGY